MLGYMADNIASGVSESVQWSDLALALESGTLLLDVRTPSEFEHGHIPSAINIPLDEIRQHASKINATEIITVCQVGQRGHSASMLLRELGFHARNLDGGYLTWKAGMNSL